MENNFHTGHANMMSVTEYPNLVNKSKEYAKSRDF